MSEHASNTKRGVITNTLAFVLLLGPGYSLDLLPFVAVAISVQYATFFFHGLPSSSEKFYDISGSLTHLSLVLSSMLWSPGPLHPRGIILSVFCVMWFTRLGSYLFARILRDGKDERFSEVKMNFLRWLGAWSLQAAWVFVLNLPVLVVNHKVSQSPLGALDAVGMALWLCGFIIESIADTQKNVFRSREANRNKFITDGLWAYSRHPNYLGEHMLWTGICISGSATFVGLEFIAWLSLGITVLLLWRVTGIPVLEAQGKKKWGGQPDYEHYMKNTNCFFFGPAATQAAKKED
jgi:steroid 5-alpha reductase family enzyme